MWNLDSHLRLVCQFTSMCIPLGNGSREAGLDWWHATFTLLVCDKRKWWAGLVTCTTLVLINALAVYLDPVLARWPAHKAAVREVKSLKQRELSCDALHSWKSMMRVSQTSAQKAAWCQTAHVREWGSSIHSGLNHCNDSTSHKHTLAYGTFTPGHYSCSIESDIQCNCTSKIRQIRATHLTTSSSHSE